MKKFCLIILVLFFGIIPCFSMEENEQPSVNARVIESEYKDVQGLSQSTSKQVVTVEITSGKFKGLTRQIDNMLTGNPAYDIPIKNGDRVILHVETAAEEFQDFENTNFFIADIKRDTSLLFLAGIFCLLLVCVGKKKGIRSLISIGATVGLIFFVLVPLILNGINPIISTTVVCILSTIITIYLVGGINSKSTSAIIGTTLSVVFSGILALITIAMARLTGFSGEDSMFLYSAHSGLNFKGILASTMILAALGALMDTAVSIASTINEIHETDKTLGVKDLFRSGMNVGHDIIGTMSNTLILVYLGNSLPLVLLSNNIDLQKFFNLNQVATEVASALIGSIAILLCVPFTAIVASWLIKNQKGNVEFKFE